MDMRLAPIALDLLLREWKRSMVYWLAKTPLYRKEIERLKPIVPAHRRAARTGNASRRNRLAINLLTDLEDDRAPACTAGIFPVSVPDADPAGMLHGRGKIRRPRNVPLRRLCLSVSRENQSVAVLQYPTVGLLNLRGDWNDSVDRHRIFVFLRQSTSPIVDAMTIAEHRVLHFTQFATRTLSSDSP